MKNISLKLSALAIGAAMLSPAFAAVTTPAKVTINEHATQKTWLTNDWGIGENGRFVSAFDVSTEAGKSFLALCVEPGQGMAQGSQNYEASAFSFGQNSTAIDRLFGLYYGQVSTSANKKDAISFQLALWELNNDNADLATQAEGSTTGFQVLATGKNDTTRGLYANAGVVVGKANEMLAGALSNTAYTQKYTYTYFGSQSSQDFVTATAISAVPEPSTYAMLGLGLAVVGFAARRRAKR